MTGLRLHLRFIWIAKGSVGKKDAAYHVARREGRADGHGVGEDSIPKCPGGKGNQGNAEGKLLCP
jgi:hypothetical protein